MGFQGGYTYQLSDIIAVSGLDLDARRDRPADAGRKLPF
jgi:hypothetical protein